MHITEVEFYNLFIHSKSPSTYPVITLKFKEYTELKGQFANYILRIIYLSMQNTEEAKEELSFRCRNMSGTIIIKREDVILAKIDIAESLKIEHDTNLPTMVYSDSSDIKLLKSHKEESDFLTNYSDYLKKFEFFTDTEKTSEVWKKIKKNNCFSNVLFWEDINYKVSNESDIRQFIDYLKNNGTQIISTVNSDICESFLLESQLNTEFNFN
ncbi:hypothetical protein [Escherichia coli]|uniref:hypothetical protein n=1 Tax=Escherichia coli TaxID=562 RepID=UPI0013D770FC|nr:hypothetical protein [Escherichia coli]MDY9503183.1 hypothetical protein [Escherichia coli]NGK52332.1 hypothetical protein [Escherichia coli]HBD5441607.1 hypothetical protein [Escherichia coli]HCQ3817662.1 hypothetical protein [Escherichia coli]HEB2125788.1 hypothetical protein [Escherichia coli]